MTSLYLLRHAKARIAEPGMRDFDRALDAKGVADCAAMASEMRTRSFKPDKVLCSAARRTRQTLDEIGKVLPLPGDVIFSEALYSAGAKSCLDEIKSLAPAASLLVIGHNPTMEDLANYLASKRDKEALKSLLLGFPTAGLAHFEFEGPISSLSAHGARLTAFIRPSHL